MFGREKQYLLFATVAMLVVPVAAYAQPVQTIPAKLDQQFQLKINQTAFIDSENLEIKFLDVVEDSRCPADVVCVWQGQATVLVNVIKNDQNLGNFNLTTGDTSLSNKTVNGYSISLVSVEPYPISSVEIDSSDYIVTLMVTTEPMNSNGVFVKASSDSMKIIAGWNIEKSKGTIIIVSDNGNGIERTVLRFIPDATVCIQELAKVCIDGISRETSQANIHVEIDKTNDKLFLQLTNNEHVLDIYKIKTRSLNLSS